MVLVETQDLGDALAQLLALLEGAAVFGRELVGAEPLAHRHLDQGRRLVLGELVDDPVESGVVQRVADAEAIGVDKGPGLHVSCRDHSAVLAGVIGLDPEEPCVSPLTVKAHVARILSQLGLHGRAELAAWVLAKHPNRKG